MLSRSAAFDRAVTYGGTVIQAVSVQRIVPGSTPSTIISGLQLLPGATITLDATAAVRRSLRGAFADPDGTLGPRLQSDALAPFGHELVVSVGFRYSDGTTELTPQGVFVLEDVDTDVFGRVSITGQDRAAFVAGQKFEQPYVIAAGTNLMTAITTLIQSRYPGRLSFAAAASALTTTLITYTEGDSAGDPMANAIDLAATGGYEVFFDATGQVVVRPIPDPTAQTSVWTYAPGAASLLLNADWGLSAADVYNVVVFTVEGSGIPTPIRSVAAVTDPTSPIYAGSAPATPQTAPTTPFGRKVKFVSQSTTAIATQAAADSTAAALLRQVAGTGEQLGFSAAPHPAHEPGDVVTVTNAILPTTVAGANSVFAVLARWDLDVGLGREARFQTLGRRAS